jgi:uncharacterized cupin superfamily protein
MPRRIVTGEDQSGRSFLAIDEQVDVRSADLIAGATFTQIWATDEPPVAPIDGQGVGVRAWFPGRTGFRFFLFSLPPTGKYGPAADPEAAARQTESQVPGLLDAQFDEARPGWHRTDTIDALHVISGQIVLLLDDGTRVTARAGDSIIQNATFHNWEVPGPADAVLVAAAIGVLDNRASD